jgi:branched-chain amino acid transport system ATP-binding protein
VALGVGYVPERRRVFAGLTVRENLEAASSLPRMPAVGGSKRCWRSFPCSANGLTRRAWLLSGGQQQMLALARAQMNGAKLLLLDEPTLGLAPAVVADLFARLATLAAQARRSC